jgi:hypothetical protein
LGKNDGSSDFWLNVGLVFPHKDGDGFNIMLQAVEFARRFISEEFSVPESTDSPNQSSKQNVRFGSFATDAFRASVDQCPLLLQ